MADRHPSVEEDIARLRQWLRDPKELRALVADQDFLRDETDARNYVEKLLLGLEAIRDGRTMSHDQVCRESEARRHRPSRIAAAE